MFNNTQALSESDKKGGDFKPYKKGLYILTVTDFKEGETDEKIWQGSGFVPTGNKIPQLELKFALMQTDGLVTVQDVDGKEYQNPPYRVWIDDSNLGWNKKEKGPKVGRAILSALLNVPADGDISFGKAEDLIGKQFKAYLGIKDVNGKEKNELLDILPVA